MKFKIESNVADRFPDVCVAVVTGKVSALLPTAQASLNQLRTEAEQRLRELLTSCDLVDHPHVEAWRSAYRSFGVNPKKSPPTHEALARRILKGKGWPQIHDLVDIYLTNQIAHLLPHGGYDAHAIEGDISLATSSGGEPFLPLGGGQESTDPDEIVYKDAVRVLTRRWNCLDCDVTKLTPITKQFVLMIETPTRTVSRTSLMDAAEDLAQRYSRCYEGEFHCQLVDASREWVIE